MSNRSSLKHNFPRNPTKPNVERGETGTCVSTLANDGGRNLNESRDDWFHILTVALKCQSRQDNYQSGVVEQNVVDRDRRTREMRRFTNGGVESRYATQSQSIRLR